MDAKLKWCPLCDFENVRLQETVHFQYVRIYCPNCGMSTIDKPAGERDQLIAYWNKRPEHFSWRGEDVLCAGKVKY
jgi:predicted RNA-binding Zn-ribbon protein involved in translation (DUF1610 family)